MLHNLIDKRSVLRILRELGFKTADTFEGNFENLENWCNCGKFSIDGAVITENNLFTEKQNNKAVVTESSVAYKFADEQAEAIVSHIEWNTGPTGRIIPTIVLKEPVELAGAMVQRASGFHAQFVKESGIGPEALITLVRANMVIPHITSVLMPVESKLPEKCPVCSSSTHFEKGSVHLYCTDPTCKARAFEPIRRVIELAGCPDRFRLPGTARRDRHRCT